MQTVTKETVLRCLQANKQELLSDWMRKLKTKADDPHAQQIYMNGNDMFELFIESLLDQEHVLNEKISIFALKIAHQRVEANINIGDFVYNVNCGRAVILKFALTLQLELDELQLFVDRLNSCFDQFLYYSVSHYSETQNNIIKEKTQFIDSTHKDRLTLLGQMTSSFIHEFRNPLTSIQGFIQLLKAEHSDMKYLDIISNEIEQLNFRISQFLLLSKKELIGKEKIVFSLNDLIDEVLIFLYPSILDGKVKTLQKLAEDIYLEGYEDEIRQVFINIIFNAIDVLSPDRINPIIEIRTLKVDDKVKVDIENNGPQIPDNLVSTIFEPFFTTKTLGTGLGLFVCREIIEKHRGTLTCTSETSKTVFSILLPIAKRDHN
ncbi:histidine kinase N-terminal domain-containing protein [Cytobacillus gottheilii]|uniref:histidine kinase n=1 Tax=Cytobacillus gottheilii TaxID=859144 RepID=A0ABX8FFG2_9BACI|nr:histidine kinase N-terminal domain-containing protein [Cytobacillus gottheilii]QVY62742.1 GHKL domain-containing protein [Cytobacillus gottheilii]